MLNWFRHETLFLVIQLLNSCLCCPLGQGFSAASGLGCHMPQFSFHTHVRHMRHTNVGVIVQCAREALSQDGWIMSPPQKQAKGHDKRHKAHLCWHLVGLTVAPC